MQPVGVFQRPDQTLKRTESGRELEGSYQTMAGFKGREQPRSQLNRTAEKSALNLHRFGSEDSDTPPRPGVGLHIPQ